MSNRAQRLGEYLEGCGWSIFGNDITFVKCECGKESDTNYCPNCGKKLIGIQAPHLEQMEAAIKYALEECDDSNL